jgi:Prokaryotic homologs of the JAB domain
MCKVSLTLTEDQRAALRAHLFPGDGLEAVAFLLCGRAAGTDRHRLLVRQVYPIAHERCKRAMNSVTWNAEDIEHLLGFAEVESLSLVKVYSHPGGYPRFSEVDDRSDDESRDKVLGRGGRSAWQRDYVARWAHVRKVFVAQYAFARL